MTTAAPLTKTKPASEQWDNSPMTFEELKSMHVYVLTDYFDNSFGKWRWCDLGFSDLFTYRLTNENVKCVHFKIGVRHFDQYGRVWDMQNPDSREKLISSMIQVFEEVNKASNFDRIDSKQMRAFLASRIS